MNSRPRYLSFAILIVLVAFGVAPSLSAETIADSDTETVGLIVSGNGDSVPVVTATATAIDPSDSSSTVPVVAQLPDTGVAAASSNTAIVSLVAMLVAGMLLVMGAFAGARQADRSVE